jgi:hypothetical protein
MIRHFIERVTTALDYTRRGWCCVPVFGKKPFGEAWDKLRISADDVQMYFGKRCNIGVLLGEPSGWLVDVDLDHGLAVQLASEFLPATKSIFGRKSKQRSHWLYNITAPAVTKKEQAVIDKKRAMLVEFRSTGCQTVFPVSIHTSGERIEWADDGEPASIAPDVLLAAVAALASEVRTRLGVSDVTEYKPRYVPIGPERSAGPDDVERCRQYVAKLPPAISGSLGHHAAFHAACECFRFGLDDEAAWAILQDYNARCVPPFGERALRHKLDSAREKVTGQGQFGDRLRRQTEVWRLQKPDEPVALWKARVHAVEHRVSSRRRHAK